MTFLQNYLTYATGNEAPPMFHIWGAFSCLSAAISRRVWLPFEDSAIFPNLYVMYVGAAGNGKSAALYKVKRTMAQVGGAGFAGIPTSGSVETAPGLIESMTGQPNADPPVPSRCTFIARWADGQLRPCHHMTITANEFINFISIDPAGWLQVLCDIYDEDKYEYNTKNKGQYTIIGPYVTLIGALTTDKAADMQKQSILSTGFARRTIFQWGERQWHNPHANPICSPHQIAARDEAVAHLRKFQKLSGKFTLETDTWWKPWYDKQLSEVPKKPPQTQSWFASKATQVQKVMMLMSLSERLDLVITEDHFQQTLGFFEELERDLYRIFGGVGRNELAAVAAKMLVYLSNLDLPISQDRLRTYFFNDCKSNVEFDDCLRYLSSDKKIKLVETQVGQLRGIIIGLPAIIDAFVLRYGGEGPPPDVAAEIG